MSIKPRDYQLQAVKDVKQGEVNLLCLPMRAGKSFISKLIIDKYNTSKALIVCGYRKIVLQFESYFPDTYTFILSGKKFDHSKPVHLATFQTYNNRDLDIAEYSLLIIDEYHSRQSDAVHNLMKQAKSNGTTIVCLTGTPITDKNKLITDGIDNFIQPITVNQMRAQGYLAPTRFFSVKDIITPNKDELKTNRADYSEKDVTEVISKSKLLESIVDQITKHKLDTEHNTLIYVNFISTADKLYNMLSSFYNVNIVHSKLSEKEQTEAIDRYHSKPGVLINVRALSLGFDSPKSDRLIFGLLTTRHSLALQIMWRSSTLNPQDSNKEAIVYDMTGQLNAVNPFSDFSEYNKPKETCMEQAMALTDPEERMLLMMSCKGDGPVTKCSSNLPSSLVDNPYVIDCTTITPHIEPCGEIMSVHEMQYDTTEDKHNIGIINKWTKCPKCGYIKKVVIKAMSTPEDLIEAYVEESNKPTNKVVSLYNKEYNKCMLIIDDCKLKSYKYEIVSSQAELFKTCRSILNNQPFKLVSNINLPKLPNVQVSSKLDKLVNLVNYDEPDKNTSLMRKIVKAYFDQLNVVYNYKKGLTYWIMKGVNNSNLKRVVKELGEIKTKQDYTDLRYWLERDRTKNTIPVPRPNISIDIDENEIPF